MRVVNYLFMVFPLFLFGQKPFKRAVKLMGCGFEITVVANSEHKANSYIDMAIAEITRIEKKISSWNPNSLTSKINKNAGIQPVRVDKELLGVVNRAVKISKLTQGAFDITYASMDNIWKFDGSMKTMPKQERVHASIKNVGYKYIIVDTENETIYLKNKGMRIGFGAIGKGYAADKAKELLIQNGVKSGIINASGDLVTWGEQPNGKDWLVAIKNPLNKKHVFSWMPVIDSSVVTSGNYEKYVKFNGEVYTHIIDPRTGYPCKGVLSVSIFTKTAELADALATSVFVMGTKSGIDLINQMKGVEAIVVDSSQKIITSNNIKLNEVDFKE